MPWVGLDAHGYGNRAKSRTIGAGARCGGLALLPALRLRARFGPGECLLNYAPPYRPQRKYESNPVAAWNERTRKPRDVRARRRVWYLDNVASAC